MRILITSRGSSGHLTPVAPFAHAALRAGHEVLAVVQDVHQPNARRLGLPSTPVPAAPPELWRPRMAAMMQSSFDEANRAMLTDYFGRLDTEHALPALRGIVQEWRPDVILRESWEFASTLVGEMLDVPVVRAGLAIGSVEEYGDGLVAPVLDELRAEHGLAPDPQGRALRGTPYLTMVPDLLEGPAAPAPAVTHRFRHPVRDDGLALPAGWWSGLEHAPLVYASFGSVASGAGLPYFPDLYRRAIDALAPLDARILLTVGEGRDLAELGALPDNVRVESWVPQETVLSHASAVVMHGGYGSMLGTLAHGVPSVAVPLFSFDQWQNAAAVARAGAGITLDADAGERRLLQMPPAGVLDGLRPAVERVLANRSYADSAGRIADAMALLPAAEAALEVLEATTQTAAV
jgi:UDP:flavonoid glycosyltransferase YjiC (YdhE family)